MGCEGCDRMNRELPCFEYLSECFEYQPETGKLFWKARPRVHFASEQSSEWWNKRFAGAEAFTAVTSSGVRHGAVDGVLYLAHRIVWKLNARLEPPTTIDHVDRDKLNNRFENLRIATNQENCRNRSVNSNNTSGALGVYRRGSKWVARICVSGRDCFLGAFVDKQDAVVCRRAAEVHYFGEFAP